MECVFLIVETASCGITTKGQPGKRTPLWASISSIEKEQYPNYIHVYLTVRDLKTGNRAEFVNKSDIINYINEKVFEGRDENYMVLEAYAGKYSIWLSNKEAAQGKV